jgi:hypothetical protein
VKGSTAVLRNTIVGNNTGGNCHGTVISRGYNLSSDDTCRLDLEGDRNGLDPLLGPLSDNGGLTQTQALLPDSPAIDAGNPTGCRDINRLLLKTDQRGEPRPDRKIPVAATSGRLRDSAIRSVLLKWRDCHSED